MTSFVAATPSIIIDPAEYFTRILTEVDAAMHNHGSKNYVEKIDFVDIMLDLRKITCEAIDLLTN